jgi:Uma2 family endonuclease
MSISRLAPQPLTAEDYRHLPDGPPFYQLIQGDLEMSPSPNSAHQIIHSNISRILFRHLEKSAAGRVLSAPFDIYLDDLNVYQPDLVFISNPRKKKIIAEQGIEGAPDLVIEILSPRTARFDREVKRRVYARTGVRELWLVDPAAEQVELYDFTTNAEVPAGTFSKRQKFTSRVLPKLAVSVSEIFSYD